MNPCRAPISAPSATPTRTATIHVYGRSRPRSKVFGIHFVWTIAIVYPRKPSSDPTDRSMLRDTMMRTIPVAMIAMDELWTDRFHRLRAVRKSPPERMWNAIQMTASEMTMPTSRVSTSVDSTIERQDRAVFASGAATGPAGTSAAPASAIVTPSRRHLMFGLLVERACPRPRSLGRGHALQVR